MGYDAEYWAWDEDIREVYEERISILSDGGPITPTMDRIARVEARLAHAHAVSEKASHGTVRFGCGL